MGENPKFVFNVGCPRIDLVKEMIKSKYKNKLQNLNKVGVGSKINFNDDFIVVSQHPVTTEYGDALDQIMITLQAIDELKFSQ